MKKRDRLILDAAKSIGINLTYSDNLGGWSRGTPYASDDVLFDPLLRIEDACEIACNLALDIETSLYSVRKAMLKNVCLAASYSKVFTISSLNKR